MPFRGSGGVFPQRILDPERALLVCFLASMRKRHCYCLIVLINSCLPSDTSLKIVIESPDKLKDFDVEEFPRGGGQGTSKGGQMPPPPFSAGCTFAPRAG